MLKFVLLLLLANGCLSVYSDQFGQFEWKRNHFGNVDYVYKNNDKILVSDEESFGLIDLNGNWLSSRLIDKSQIEFDVEKNDRIIALNTKQNAIEVYNPWKMSLDRVINMNMQDDPGMKVVGFKLLNGVLGVQTQDARVGTLKSGQMSYNRLQNAEPLAISGLVSEGQTSSENVQNFLVLYRSLEKGDNRKLCVREVDSQQNIGKAKCHRETENITAIVPIENGFIVYTQETAVIVSYENAEYFSKKDTQFVRSLTKSKWVLTNQTKDDHFSVYRVDKTIKKVRSIKKSEYNCSATHNIGYNNNIDKDHGIICMKEHQYSSKLKDFYLSFINLDKVDEESEVQIIVNLPARMIKNSWMFQDSKGVNNFIVLGDEMSMNYYIKDKNPEWTREDGLSRIIDTQILNYSADQTTEKLWAEYESIVKDKMWTPDSILSGFMYRLQANLRHFVDLLEYFKELASKLSIDEIVQKLKGKNLFTELDQEFLDRYNIHKQIIVTTSNKVVFGIDSLQGDILWKRIQPVDAINLSVEKMNERHPENFYGQVKVVFDYSGGGYQQTVVIEGKNGDLETLSKGIKKAKNQNIHLSEEEKVSYNFKENLLESDRDLTNFNFYKLWEKSLKGYSYIDEKFQEVWNVSFDKEEQVLDYSHHLKGHTNYYEKAYAGFFIHVPEENKVIYKIVDSSNIAILTKFPSKMPEDRANNIVNLNVYVVNTRSGRLLQQFTQSGVNANHNIAQTYDDNGIFISYFNNQQKFYELWVIEIFEEQIESSFISMINKFALQTQKNREVDYFNENGNFVLQDQKFGLQVGIKSFKPVQTKAGLTRRNLIAITTDDDIYSIDRYLISTRRPFPVVETPKKKKKKNEPEEEEITYQSSFLPMFDYMIPFNPKQVQNADYVLYGLKNLHVTETDFESTAVVFTYGKDMFWCKITPDKTFDMLNDDFAYPQLLAIVFGITIGLFVVIKYSSSKESKMRFLN